jgi:hypothetical protein
LDSKITESSSGLNLKNYVVSNSIISAYREKLRRNPTTSELNHFLSTIEGKNMTLDDFHKELDVCDEHKTLLSSRWEGLPEPNFIFVSCFNDTKGTGGIFLLKDNLIPLIEGTGYFGLCYDTEHNILFCATRSQPQILAFQITPDGRVLKIPVKFHNYIFANDAHGILTQGKKIFLVATQGEEPPQLSEKPTDYGKFIGKIIQSDINIDIENNIIEIRNSVIHNPFNCNHHHHINDLCVIENNLYFSSFSFCEYGNPVENGAISKFDSSGKSIVVATNMDKPHSMKYFKQKLYVASSGSSQILSIDLDGGQKIEYKGPDSFIRGLTITENYIYLGVSWGLGRTNSKFTSNQKGILRFDKTSGETKLIKIPDEYDNVYDIVSDWP